MSDEVGRELDNNIGKFIEVDWRVRQSDQAKFMRVKVDLQLDKPLRRGGKVFASLVWCLWPKNPLHTHGINKSFLDSIIFILSHATLHDLELFFAIACAIWINRNKIVHKDCSLPPPQVWQLAKIVTEDYVSLATGDLGQIRTPPSN